MPINTRLPLSPIHTLEAGLQEITHEDYDTLARSDPATMQSYLEVAASDPESYPWESVIYTLREALGEAGGEATAEAAEVCDRRSLTSWVPVELLGVV